MIYVYNGIFNKTMHKPKGRSLATTFLYFCHTPQLFSLHSNSNYLERNFAFYNTNKNNIENCVKEFVSTINLLLLDFQLTSLFRLLERGRRSFLVFDCFICYFLVVNNMTMYTISILDSWLDFCNILNSLRILFSNFQTSRWFTIIRDILSICREMQLDCNLTLELRFLEPSQDEKRFSSTSQFSLFSFHFRLFFSSITATTTTTKT